MKPIKNYLISFLALGVFIAGYPFYVLDMRNNKDSEGNKAKIQNPVAYIKEQWSGVY